MCFSTTASFVAGTLLTGIGIMAHQKVKDRSQLLFASIPFVFAAQQFTEGFVWLALSKSISENCEALWVNAFLMIAMVIWPIWIPLAILLIEKDKKRKKLLKLFLGIGIIVSVLAGIYLFTRHSEARITYLHVHYDLDVPYNLKLVLGIMYLFPTILSQLVSGNRRVVVMGILVLCSYLVSIVFFNDTVLSVWCFFSAIISILIYHVLANKAPFFPKKQGELHLFI